MRTAGFGRRAARFWVVLAIFLTLAATAGAQSGGQVSGAGGDDGLGILRWDPLNGRLTPVPQNELRPNFVYSYYNPRLQRRSWSYLQANGRMWFALGEGTLLSSRHFDLRLRHSDIDTLRARLPALSEELNRPNAVLYLRLDRNDRWRVFSGGPAANIYNAETGQRWEYQFRTYMPVSHVAGYRWIMRSGRYVPAG